MSTRGKSKRLCGQKVAALGLLGAVLMVFVLLACSTRLEPVTAVQRLGIDQFEIPHITMERLQDCTAENGMPLEPRFYGVQATIEIDENANSRDVTIDGIPDTADNLASCVRLALSDMAIPRKLVLHGADQLNRQREQAIAKQSNLLGTPIVLVVAGVTILVTEVMLEAGAITILLATTVKVVDKAADDVAELVKRRRIQRKDKCTDYYEECVASSLWRRYGRHEWDSLCSLCASACYANKGIWPASVGVNSCDYRTN